MEFKIRGKLVAGLGMFDGSVTADNKEEARKKVEKKPHVLWWEFVELGSNEMDIEGGTRNGS